MVQEEQTLMDETIIFQKWLSYRSPATSCRFLDLRLTKINQIVAQHLFDQTSNTVTNFFDGGTNIMEKWTSDLTARILSTAKNMTQTCTQKISDEQAKLHKTRDKMDDETQFDDIIKAIETRTANMTWRAQHNT